MDFRASAVKRKDFDINNGDLFFLKGEKQLLQNAVFSPAVYAFVYCTPFPIGVRQRPPFAAVFRNIQNSVYQSKVVDTNITALKR